MKIETATPSQILDIAENANVKNNWNKIYKHIDIFCGLFSNKKYIDLIKYSDHSIFVLKFITKSAPYISDSVLNEFENKFQNWRYIAQDFICECLQEFSNKNSEILKTIINFYTTDLHCLYNWFGETRFLANIDNISKFFGVYFIPDYTKYYLKYSQYRNADNEKFLKFFSFYKFLKNSKVVVIFNKEKFTEFEESFTKFCNTGKYPNNAENFTIEDLDACWDNHKQYLLEILNGCYDIVEARQELRFLIGSDIDKRK